MPDPHLSVIIVSYNVSNLLEHCLVSLMRAADDVILEIIVVDNASSDRSAEMVRAKFPHVQLIANSENVGFARANNQGLAVARGRYWMLLNPDTEIPQNAVDSLATLVAFMDSHPRAAVCGASLFYPDGTRQHSAFRFPSLAQIYMDLYPVNWRLRDSALNGRYPISQYERGAPFQIDHPLGAAIVVRPDAATQVGLLDEDFFIYAEEVDWCIRFKRAGWQVWCVPFARITHHEARSTRQFRDKMFVELWNARFHLFRKHYGPVFNWAARVLVQRGMERAMRAAQADAARGIVTQQELERRMDAYRQVISASRQ